MEQQANPNSNLELLLEDFRTTNIGLSISLVIDNSFGA